MSSRRKAQNCRKHAATYQAKLDDLRTEHVESDEVPNDPYRVWGDVFHHRQRAIAGWQKRALKYESWAAVLRDVLAVRSVSVSG